LYEIKVQRLESDSLRKILTPDLRKDIGYENDDLVTMNPVH